MSCSLSSSCLTRSVDAFFRGNLRVLGIDSSLSLSVTLCLSLSEKERERERLYQRVYRTERENKRDSERARERERETCRVLWWTKAVFQSEREGGGYCGGLGQLRIKRRSLLEHHLSLSSVSFNTDNANQETYSCSLLYSLF